MADFKKLLGNAQREKDFRPDNGPDLADQAALELAQAAQIRKDNERAAAMRGTCETFLGRLKRDLETGNDEQDFLIDLLISAVDFIKEMADSEKAEKDADKAVSLLMGIQFMAAAPEDLAAQTVAVMGEIEGLKAGRELAEPEERITLDHYIRARERRLTDLLKGNPAVKKILAKMAATKDPDPVLLRVEKNRETKSERLKVTVVNT